MQPVSHTGTIGIVKNVMALTSIFAGLPKDTLEYADKAAAAVVQQPVSGWAVARPVMTLGA